MDEGGVLISQGRMLFSCTFLIHVIVQNTMNCTIPYIHDMRHDNVL